MEVSRKKCKICDFIFGILLSPYCSVSPFLERSFATHSSLPLQYLEHILKLVEWYSNEGLGLDFFVINFIGTWDSERLKKFQDPKDLYLKVYFRLWLAIGRNVFVWGNGVRWGIYLTLSKL